MMKTTVFTVFSIVAHCCAAPSEELPDTRVVGGSTAGIGDYPYQASLRDEANRHFCGGSIISSRTVLTAAHCLAGRTTQNTLASVGTNHIQGGTIYASSLLVTHSGFNSNTFENDISLVITKTTIIFNPKIQPITVSRALVRAGETVILTGWGLTSYPGYPSTNLQVITLRTISVENCRNRIGSKGSIYNSSLCTFAGIGQSACMGDSGGPLVTGGNLVGIVSWGMPCAKGYPDIFTRVSSYIPWISANIV